MDKYYHYWRFFCENTFAQEDKLQFFDDGSFAISTSRHVVSLYSNKAELISRFENSFVLDNGCICERYGGNLIIHSGEKEQYYIPCPSSAKVKPFATAVVFELSETKEDSALKVSELYFVTPKKQDLRHISFKNQMVDDVSASGMVALRGPGECVLLDENQQPLPLRPFFRIDFLVGGQYIVHFRATNSGCSLYNAKHERVLHSTQDFGISALGNKVLYEQALIVSPETGAIISEYNNEVAVYDTIRIYKYKVLGYGHPYLWLGGKMVRLHTEALGWLLCYWHDGHFYIAPQRGYQGDREKLLRCKDNSPAWQHYVTRILDIMP